MDYNIIYYTSFICYSISFNTNSILLNKINNMNEFKGCLSSHSSIYNLSCYNNRAQSL